MIYSLSNFVKIRIPQRLFYIPTIVKRESLSTMNLNEECLLKYLQNPDELIDLTNFLLELNLTYEQN